MIEVNPALPKGRRHILAVCFNPKRPPWLVSELPGRVGPAFHVLWGRDVDVTTCFVVLMNFCPEILNAYVDVPF